MTRILFNGHDFKFLSHLIEYCEQHDDYQVIMDYIPGHEMSHIEQSLPLLEQADLIFCEWALGNAEWYSKNKKPDQKLVIRLHHQEINLPYLERIHWPHVDQIVFICPENMEIFLHRFPQMSARTTLIYNVIDCADLDQPKLPGARFNLGFIGTAPMRKSPHLAVELFSQIKKVDDRFMLYIKGKHPWEYPWLWRREEERSYYERMYNRINQSVFANSIVFDPHGNDMPEWFSKIGFILSTSEHEGSHQAVAEGMAAGSIPVIRNWAGADKLYPPRFVVKTIDEAVKMILKYQEPALYHETTDFIKTFAVENFDRKVIIAKYTELFQHLFSSSSKIIHDQSANTISVKPKSLSVIHLCFLSIGSQSGYEVRVVEETKALGKAGVRVLIIAFHAAKWLKEPDAIASHKLRLETMTGATVVFLPTDRYFDLRESDPLWGEIDEPVIQLARLHEVGIIHGQALYSAHHAIRIAKKAGLKVVLDNHGVTPEETAMMGGNSERVNALTRFEKETIESADFRIFVSDRMNDFYIQKYSIKSIDYQLVPCCVRIHDFALPEEERRRIRNEKGFGDKTVILYLGTLSVWQWPAAMFELYSKYRKINPDSILYLLIPAYDHGKAMEYAVNAGLTEDCFILEEVQHGEVGKLIGVADAGLLLREPHPVNLVSSPTKFGEYLAAGIPVILTEGIGDYSAIAKEKKVGITLQFNHGKINPQDVDQLHGFLKDVMAHREEWKLNCRNVAAELLDWDSYGEKIAGIYKSLQIK